MLDRYFYGITERLSPEGPIPVLSLQREVSMLGGVGNVVRNLTELRSRVIILSVVGNDAAGQSIVRLLKELDQVTCQVLQHDMRQTTLKTRYISGAQQLLRVDREEVRPIAMDLQQQLCDAFDQAVQEAGAVVLSDYGKGLLTRKVVRHVIQKAKELQIPVVIDPKGPDYSMYRQATVVTPNRKELAEATKTVLTSMSDVEIAAKKLREEWQLEAVLATLSADGMLLVNQDGTSRHLPTASKGVFDVSGAGDTVVATIAAGLASQLDLVDCASIANLAAGIVVGKTGTATATIDEIAHQVHLCDAGNSTFESVDRIDLQSQFAQWKSQGLTVGFTNGCFDIFHAGHVRLLQDAKEECDRLVVGLNSDSSVRRLKGATRPIQDQLARSIVVGGQSAVDSVVIFDEDTPLELIKAIRPDLLLKGADYSTDQVVGAELVQSYGGRVVLIPLVEEQSTTGIVDKIIGTLVTEGSIKKHKGEKL